MSTATFYNKSIYFEELIKIEWAVFGVLTWKDPRYRAMTGLGIDARDKEFWDFIMGMCVELRLRSKYVGVYKADEFDPHKHGHIHFLIAKDGLAGVEPRVLVETLKENWAKGQCYIEPFDISRGTLGGASYASKNPQHELPSKGLIRLFKKNAIEDVLF